MKIYAQHGHGEGEKISIGLQDDFIQGVIFSPRNITPTKLQNKLTDLKSQYPQAELLLDPQYYTCFMGSKPNLNIGKLSEYQTHYFSFETKSKLEIEKNVSAVLQKSNEYQHHLPLSAIITPNIFISNSFDSREGVIAKNFIRLAKANYLASSRRKPLYCSIVISSEALKNLTDVQEFLNDLTVMDDPPDGFYLLVHFNNSEARAEIFNPDVIASWMLFNYSLKINGYNTINGYSDLISPFLGAVGADVCCSGWYSNLRTFSLERFAPANTGGQLPIQRYLSAALLNRITFYELEAVRRVVPEVINNLDTDTYFKEGGDEPERNKEVLQTWEALKFINEKFTDRNIINNMNKLNAHIDNASELYLRINRVLQLHIKSNSDHLEPLKYAIEKFRKIAEI
ncbi:MAG: hypothetical protein ACYC4T_06720 [Melioribacteraceae bacterium]